MKYGVIFSLCCWITLVGGSEGAIVDCVTEDKKQPCLFPYQYEGSLRFECVKLSSRSRKESFCPTSTDDQGKVSVIVVSFVVILVCLRIVFSAFRMGTMWIRVSHAKISHSRRNTFRVQGFG